MNNNNQFDFGTAIKLLKDGKKVARTGWNGKSMHLFLLHGTSIQSIINENYNGSDFHHEVVDSLCMKTAQDTVVVGWLASQTDILAEDWMLVQ